jgi:hypothetical protein
MLCVKYDLYLSLRLYIYTHLWNVYAIFAFILYMQTKYNFTTFIGAIFESRIQGPAYSTWNKSFDRRHCSFINKDKTPNMKRSYLNWKYKYVAKEKQFFSFIHLYRCYVFFIDLIDLLLFLGGIFFYTEKSFFTKLRIFLSLNIQRKRFKWI